MSVSQSEFIATLFDPKRAVPDGLRDPEGRIAGKRFDVYRNNVASSLSDALETAFPVIRKLVGVEFFRAMSGVYLRAHPPSTPLMMFYGDDMAAFLRGFTPVEKLPYLPDMARLELAMRHAYHARDAAPIDPAKLGEIAPEKLGDIRLKCAPALQLIRSDHPIHAIYLANTTGGTTDDSGPSATGENTLITRPNFDPQIHLISNADADFVDTLKSGGTLNEASAAGGDGFDPSPIISLLLAHNALTKIH